MYTIHDAHNKVCSNKIIMHLSTTQHNSFFIFSPSQGVTALGCLSTNRHVVSGGGEGQVRIWEVMSRGETKLKEALKEHKGTVTCIRITRSDEEVHRINTVEYLRRFKIYFLMCSSVYHRVLMEHASFGT